MSFPNYPEKHEFDSIFNAEDIVAYRKRLGRMPDIKTPFGALFCLDRGLPEQMRWHIPVRRAGSMNADVHVTKRTKNPVVILTNFGGGAAIVAELAEELVVMGAKKLILMTWAGTLQPGLKAGDIVVCNRALRDDGTSQHYLPPARYIDGDDGLADQLVAAVHAHGGQCAKGATWTTAAPYRETRMEVRQYQSEGVQVVEMETAGLFTIGHVRKIPATAAVVVMDSLASLTWQVPDRLDGIQRSLKRVYQASIEILAKD